LGPYKQALERYLFEEQQAPLEVLVGRASLLMADGSEARIAIPPYSRRMGEWRVWHFFVGGLDVYLKTDKRPFPQEWRPYLANGNDPLTLPTIDPLPVAKIKMLHPIFRKMASA